MLNVENVLALNHLGSLLIDEGQGASTEIIRLHDCFIIFTVPLFGGESIFEGMYRIEHVENMIKDINNWS